MLLITGATLAAAVAAPPAVAGPAEDYHNIRADWAADATITPCRWTEEQLVNARQVASGVPDDQYTSFPADIDREIARHRSGACQSRTPEEVRERSPIADVTIVRVSGRGTSASEYLRLRNTGTRTADLSRARLYNRRGSRVLLPQRFRVRPGRTVTVRIGCRRGSRRGVVVGSRAYACRRSSFLSDSGDVVRLSDRTGVVVSQRGYGRYGRTVPF